MKPLLSSDEDLSQGIPVFKKTEGSGDSVPTGGVSDQQVLKHLVLLYKR